MAKNTDYFEHESLQDKESIINYLNALADGIKKGEVIFSDEEERLEIQPEKIGQFRVRASQTKKTQEIRLKLSWSNKKQSDLDDTPLFIQAKKNK